MSENTVELNENDLIDDELIEDELIDDLEFLDLETLDVDALQGHVRALEVLLRHTRRARDRTVRFEGFLWLCGALLAVVLTTLLFALIAPEKVAVHTVPWMLYIGAGAVCVVGLLFGVYTIFHRSSELEVARLLQTYDPSLRHDLVAALIFGRSVLRGSFDEQGSLDLAQAHIERTAMRMGKIAKDGSLAHLLPGHQLGPALMMIFCSLLVLLIPMTLKTQWTLDTLTRAFATPMNAMEQTRGPVLAPLLGNISLTYHYPSYAHKADAIELMTSGHIEALAGTKVSIRGYPLLRRAKDLSLVLHMDSGEEQVVSMKGATGARVQAQLILQESGAYTFRAVLADGTVVQDGIMRQVDVHPDRKPAVEILSHKGEIEVTPKDVLKIEFAAEDDFGVESMAYVRRLMLGGEEPSAEDVKAVTTRVPIRLDQLKGVATSKRGVVMLDLSTFDLQAGDHAQFFIEAVDNNTRTGPGIGKSVPIILKVSSPEDKHVKNIQAQQELLELVLSSLADFLEAPVGERKPKMDGAYIQRVSFDESAHTYTKRFDAIKRAHAQERALLFGLSELVVTLRQDPLMVPRDLTMYSSMESSLKALHGKGARFFDAYTSLSEQKKLTTKQMQQLATFAADSEALLEKTALQMDDLLASQKMSSVKDAAQEIKNLKARLKALLLKYKDTPDPALKKAIRREMMRLRQRIKEMLQRMSSQMKEMPKEHVNLDAMNMKQLEQDAGKMKTSFENIEQMLENDDIDGALKALEDMGKNLEHLTQDLNDKMPQPERLSELDREVSRLMDEIQDLSTPEQELEQETMKLQEKLDQELTQETDAMIKEATKNLLQEVKEQEKDMNTLQKMRLSPYHQSSIKKAKKSLRALRKNLEQKDIAESAEGARRMFDALEHMRQSMKFSLRSTPKHSERARRTRAGVHKSTPMVERAQKMLDHLEQLMDTAKRKNQTRRDPRIKKLALRQKKLRQRAQKLQDRLSETAKKFPSLKERLAPAIKQAKEGMKEAQDSLGQKRMQRALDSERRVVEQLKEMKQQMKKELQKDRNRKKNQSKQNVSRPKIEIPHAEQSSSPGFRKAIEETMKEERLRDYADDIEDYYKSLVH